MKFHNLIFLFSLVSCRSLSENHEIQVWNNPVVIFDEISLVPNHGRVRRSYSDFEDNMARWLDQLDFYLSKVTIFQNIILDIRQLYKVLKNDVLAVSTI